MLGPNEALYRLPIISIYMIKTMFLEESNIWLLNSLKLQHPRGL